MAVLEQMTGEAGAGVVAGPLLAVSLLSLSIGVWVLVRERGRQIALSFFATTAAVAVYLFGFSFMSAAPDPAVALFWGKIAYLGIPFIVPAIYHFSVDLLGLGARRRRVVRTAWGIGIGYLCLAVATDLLVPGVVMTPWGYITRLTPWNIPILLWSTTLLALVIRDYTRAYHDADAVQRARIRWFAIPIAVASLGFIDYLPSMGVPVLPAGFAFFPVFLLSAAWTINRHHLPDLTPAFAAEQIIATMADALLVCDAAGNVVLANAAAGRLLDYDPADLQGVPLPALFGASSGVGLLRDTVLERETVALTRTGTAVDLSVSTGRLHDRGGQVVGTVVVGRDIRERRRAALEIERREQRFRALTENALDTITILDRTGRITYQSPAASRLGYDPEQDIGRDIFERVHPEDVARLQDVFGSVLDRQGGTAEAEARIRRADGEYRVFELRGRNLTAHPAVRGVVVNGRDITDERDLASQLQQAQKLEAIGRLAGGIAHDFNNILTAVQGNVAFMAEALPAGSPLLAELTEVRRGAERAARLTEQLLAFSRRTVVRPRRLDLNALVGDLGSRLGRIIGGDLRFETRLDPDLAPIRADRVQIEQVVVNLVANARDAVETGGRIEVATAALELREALASGEALVPPGSYAALVVSDDGHGMDDRTRSRIFDPFFTTRALGKGIGLGLSTVYGSVRQAGGFIAVESEPGRGSRFTLYFPSDVAGSATDPLRPGTVPAGAADASEVSSDIPSRAADVTLLVVEDEAPVRTLMTRILKREGYRVLEAEDGTAAIHVAGRHDGPIHLLVTDLVMPGLGGREVAERLTIERPGLRTLFVSGYTADEVVRRGVLSGEHLFLGKPFTPSDLVEMVRGMLHAARQTA